jgi:hypothetical protein
MGDVTRYDDFCLSPWRQRDLQPKLKYGNLYVRSLVEGGREGQISDAIGEREGRVPE